MSLDKIVKKNNTRFLVVLLLFSSFFTGTIIISTTALNVSSRTSGSSQVTESSSPSLYPFPKSPHPASTLYFTGVGGPGTPLGFTVAALQGIVARTQPQIFLTT